jgi:hypothetical protein
LFQDRAPDQPGQHRAAGQPGGAGWIQGKPVPEPASGDDQKALIYDLVSDEFIYGEAGGGAQIDHGGLVGLGDDDHPQYFNQARGDARYLLQDPMHVHFHDFTVGADTSTIYKGLYQAVPVTDLKDSAGNTWSGAGRNTGTYMFRPGDNSNIWPTTATAVTILIGGNWTTSNNNYQMNARRSSGGTNESQIRALVASLMVTLQVIQAVDANDYFYINISGANMNASVVRIVGYFI